MEPLKTALAGRYDIERQIGEGGMATVYVARDLRHSRRVAIKVLKRELGAILGAERFLAEIAVTASLQHPHLLPLFDSGEAAGLLYYVMPYVEGETLRHRLTRDRLLPIDESVRLVRGIASALDYAHKRGVVHRDLKPENILLHEGEPLVSDFGIALAVSNAAGERITQSGMSVGTPQYMSPEQAAGDHHIDARSDVYSLGAVLYEMLTGEPPHTGPTPQSVIAKIISEEPRLAVTLRKAVPDVVEAALERALEKLPADRFASAGDFADALSLPAASAGMTRQRVHGRGAGAAFPRRAAWTTAAAAALGAVLMYAMLRAFQTLPPGQLANLQLLPPKNLTFESIAVSPDGRQFAFTASDSAGRTQLWIRPIDSDAARPLNQTEGASQPFWSPDSKSIGFFAEGKLKRVDAAGGTPQTLCTLPSERGGPRGGSWGRQGVIIFSIWEYHPAPIYQVAERGGEPRALTTLEDSSGQSHHWWPTFLPDGRHFLYFAVNNHHRDRTGIFVAALDTRDARLVLHTSAAGAFALLPSRSRNSAGYLLTVEEGTLKARRFDVESFLLDSSAVSIADGVGVDRSQYRARVTASETGVLALGSGVGFTQMRWFDREGLGLALIGSPGLHIDLKIAPDDRRVIAQREDDMGHADLWLVDATRSTRITFGSDYHAAPVWRPDGGRITFFAVPQGRAWQIMEKASSGAGDEALMLSGVHDLVPSDWSPNGKTLLFSEIRSRQTDVWTWSSTTAADTAVRRPFAATDADENFARFSPDGRWVAYQSNQSGRNEVYVRPFPPEDAGPGGTLVSVGGGTQPRWPRHGHEIFYVASDNTLMVVRVRTDPTFQASTPRPLFRLRPAGVIWYDVTSDGQRVLVATPVDSALSAPATIVLNWFEAIERRSKLSPNQ